MPPLFFLCIALLCACQSVRAQRGTPPPIRPAQKTSLSGAKNASLAARLAPLLSGPGLAGGIVGAEVVDARSGKVLFAKNETTRLLPASNAKLFTAAAALQVLGEKFTWTTKVVSTQKQSAAGVVDGDVRLIGSGDASLTTADMDDLAAQMAQSGIKQITGTLQGSALLFPDGPYGFGWEWDDFDDEEFAQISALTINDGDVAVHVTGGKTQNDAPYVVLEPNESNGFQSSATTSAAGTPPALHLHRSLSGGFLSVSGTIPAGATVTTNVPVPDPPHYAAFVLTDALQKRHVTIDTDPSRTLSTTPTGAVYPVTLASHTSAPLSQYVTHMLKESDNLYAECLVRTVGVQKGGDGTFAAGLVDELPVFKALGVETNDITLVDGCGVGRRNYVTARAVCGLLVGMKKSPHWTTFYNALPIAGVDGTLKSRLKNTPAQGNCHAKTGTLGAVRALSGYVTGKSGREYAFSLLLNNFPGTAKQAGAVQDAVVTELAAHG